jgi:hypothetical protein
MDKQEAKKIRREKTLEQLLEAGWNHHIGGLRAEGMARAVAYNAAEKLFRKVFTLTKDTDELAIAAMGLFLLTVSEAEAGSIYTECLRRMKEYFAQRGYSVETRIEETFLYLDVALAYADFVGVTDMAAAKELELETIILVRSVSHAYEGRV